MPRIKRYTKILTVKVDDKQMEKLKKYAQKCNLTMNEVIRCYINRLK